MDQVTIDTIKKHFREWSGGFSPFDENHITVYLDYAAAALSVNERIAWERIFEDWIESDDPDADLYPSGTPRPRSFAGFMRNSER